VSPGAALKPLAGLGVVIVLVVIALVGLLWVFQRRLVYLPMDHEVPTAGKVLAGAEDVSFVTADGLRLGGWFVPARGPVRAAVLVCNGNAGNRSHRSPLAAALAEQGFTVLLFDYRGYGGNPGSPTERGLAADVRAARGWLEAQPRVDPERVVLFGESLGAAVALAEAVERPAAGLVLRSPFSSLADVAREHYPFLPVRLLLKDRYPSLERVPRLECPLLVLAGRRDGIIPASQSRALFEAAPPDARRLVMLDGDHNDLELLAGERMIREMVSFIHEATMTEGP
jgi:fermentation-respiration switch protein FrsA (DUF1100 family)